MIFCYVCFLCKFVDCKNNGGKKSVTTKSVCFCWFINKPAELHRHVFLFLLLLGKEAYRSNITGGWLLYAVSEGLKKWPDQSADEDLLQVLTGVIRKIALESETENGCKSAACFTHMLVKDIYLLPTKI